MMGSADCSGAISATFTWMPDDDSDKPPYNAIVIEDCEVSATAFSYWNPSPGNIYAQADNGIGSPVVTSGDGTNFLSVTSSGKSYWVKTNPGYSFQVTRSPYGRSGGFSGFFNSYVHYKASAPPVIVTLGGTTKVGSSKQALIGQGITATISVGGVTYSNWNWPISGNVREFKSYDVDADHSHARLWKLNSLDYIVPEFHFYCAYPGAATVNCTVTIKFFEQQPPMTVTGKTDVGIVEPASVFTKKQGAAQVVLPPRETPPRMAAYAGGVENSLRGCDWFGSVKTPQTFDPMLAGLGNWHFVQIVTTSRFTWQGGNAIPNPQNGTGLDGSYPYAPAYPGWICDGTMRNTGDSPWMELADTLSKVSAQDSFETYQMYLPPGGDVQWVPVKHLSWSWTAIAIRPPSGHWVDYTSNVDAGIITVAEVDLYPPHPEWYRIVHGTN